MLQVVFGSDTQKCQNHFNIFSFLGINCLLRITILCLGFLYIDTPDCRKCEKVLREVEVKE